MTQYYGHGAPTALNPPSPSAGDVYIDVDTNDVYSYVSDTELAPNLFGAAENFGLAGNPPTNINLTAGGTRTSFKGQIEPNTDYTISRYEEGNRMRIAVFEYEPETGIGYTSGFSQLQGTTAVTAPATYTFNSGTYTWVVLTLDVSHWDATERAKLEPGTEATPYYITTSYWELSSKGERVADLFGNRANETYTYRRVSWPDFNEGADLGNVTAGSVELSAFSDLKATCSFQYEGGTEPSTNDLVRIYYSFDDDNGEHAEFCIGTFFIGYSDTAYRLDGDNLIASGRVNGWSTLKVLQDIQMGYAYTVNAGTYAIAKAIQLIQDAGLPVNVANESSYQLANDHTFDPKDTLLTVVNWLCTTANYQAPYPDAYGTIQIQQYVDPSERATVATFQDDENSIMYPDVSVENDWQEIPNVYRLYYSTDELAIHAEARNVSGSKASLDARGGRELVEVEGVSELTGADSSAKLANLEAMAAKILLNNSQEIERVELSHPYIPLVANDAVSIRYADRSWSGNVQNMRIDLSPSTECDTTIRRFVPSNITVTTSSVIDYESAS